ncbi:Claudin 2 domain containing protein [Trichuris trichiura]|uniref:Claudin 2 domain containing protein n=1 Tax=Trichuris trichiura TaxID=36087 RepID=A0A077ZDV2_TRITR|nr:Claudin 2 domain containing protein [Trichuris trichiura]
MLSPVILSFSSVFSLLGTVLVIIAFGTNNWQEFRVNRTALLRKYTHDSESRPALSNLNQTAIFFDRTLGLFRECFPTDVPNGSGTYTDPMGNQCRNLIDYQIPEDSVVVRSYSYYQLIRMRKLKSLNDSSSDRRTLFSDMMRTCIGLYIVGLVVLSFCLLIGIRGCWRRHLSLIMMTGILLLFAISNESTLSALLLIAAVAVWHGVDYIERELIDRKPFYKTWPSILRQSTDISYGWSYMIAWIGIGFILISSILMLVAHRKMKEEEETEMDAKAVPYMIPSYHEKIMMMPYAHNYYGGYPQQMYGGSYGAPMTNGYYGYLNYGH